ncbi:MAG TPA: NAD(P)/FAD-dependent oxidoreductase, partial [Trueperaceae bacterium]|nr:NAD(P)/FAD-dependent oxidoreductase [Trueperaceae bacterium]
MIQFAVVGAGPVGLYVACLLAAAGRDVVVLDESDGATGSRSIGIHPPALEALELAGVAEELLACGSRIENARLMLGADHVGDLPLRDCPGPYSFVLTLPQHETERILCDRLERSRPGALRRGTRVVDVRRQRTDMELLLEDGGSLSCRFVIGCDGRLSRVREALGVPLAGGALKHHYLMADMPEDGMLGEDAAISLGAEGVVESFPLPGQRRRWVARFSVRPDGLTAQD